MYKHISLDNQLIDLPVGKIVCVGLNYRDHVAEMGSELNDEAVLFMKPSTAMVPLTTPFNLPIGQGECHNEAEIAVLIKSQLTNATESDVASAIWGYGIGLDLTLRNVQKQLKTMGRPWERSKAFDGSAPLSPFIEKSQIANTNNIEFSLKVNDEIRQQGTSILMIRPIEKLISIISQHFTLLPGDVIFTGTPAGVAPLNAGDSLHLSLNEFEFLTQVAHD